MLMTIHLDCYVTTDCKPEMLSKQKYRKAEYVQRHVPSSNVQVFFVFEVILIVLFHRRLSSIAGRLPSNVVFHQRSSSIKCRVPSKVIFRINLL